MNQRPTPITRFHIIAALSLALLCVYLVVLFNIQVVHHEDYLAQSIQTITRVENVKASRGIITDRSGRTLVSNQYTYSLTFDPTLLRSGEDQNEAILRLVTLCREQGVAWEDNLPLSLSAPAQFTLDGFTDTQKARFFAYLRDLKPAQSLLAAYARTHTELLKPPAEGSEPQDLTLLKDAELAKQIDSSLLTTALLEDMGNLVANELYDADGAGQDAAEAAVRGVERLHRQCAHLIVVSNEVFRGGADYAGDTARYLLALARVNNAVAARAGHVCRVVCGLPRWVKGGDEFGRA